MKLLEAPPHSTTRPDPATTLLLESVRADALRDLVTRLSVPRHFTAESRANREIGDFIETEFASMGYKTQRHGSCANILAVPQHHDGPCPEILLGAHYDSVPGTPGADDNASAVAGMLAVARALSPTSSPVGFVAFNREEDDLFGSREFVADFVLARGIQLREVHVLEMIGYCDHRPGTQSLPPELPIDVGDVGDFIALVCNDRSNHLAPTVLDHAATYLPGFPVKALQVFGGKERLVHHLERSDHSPFWHAGIPATMWTDTSEFRNQNYHQSSDTPESLDYEFLKKVVQVLVAYLAGRSA